MDFVVGVIARLFCLESCRALRDPVERPRTISLGESSKPGY